MASTEMTVREPSTHEPSTDIVAGAALGVASVTAVWWIIRRHDRDQAADPEVAR